MTAIDVLVLLAFHTVADFMLQTDWQARNKWQSARALWSHVFVYSACLVVWAVGFTEMSMVQVFGFFLMTVCTHGLTDLVTSQFTHKYGACQEWHSFFVVVGVDQYIHAWTLVVTAMVILRG